MNDLNDLLKFIDEWRAKNGINYDGALTQADFERAAKAVQVEAMKFSVKPQRVSWGDWPEFAPTEWKSDARLLAYSGGFTNGQQRAVQAFQIAQTMSQYGNGDCFGGIT